MEAFPSAKALSRQSLEKRLHSKWWEIAGLWIARSNCLPRDPPKGLVEVEDDNDENKE